MASRIDCAIVEVGKKFFRDRINEEYENFDLKQYLANNKTTIKKHKEHEVISQDQYDLLYPAVGQPSLSTLNIGLLVFIIRIFDYDNKLWYQTPHENDFTLVADVVRIQNQRDAITETETQIAEAWETLSKIFLRKEDNHNWQTEIETIKENGSSAENQAQEEIKVWKSMDQRLKSIGFDLSPSEESTRKLKLYRLIIDGGGQVLKGLVDNYVPPSSLPPTITRYRNKFNFLLRKRVIDMNQYNILIWSRSSADFDITLLSVLLRNICRLKPSNDQVWKSTTEQLQGDFSVEAEIVRIRNIRNEIQHIPPSFALTEQVFNYKWNELKQVLLRLNSITLFNNMEDEIENLKQEIVSANKQTEYEAQIQAWIDSDTRYTNEIENMILQNSVIDAAYDRSKLILDIESKDTGYVRTKQFDNAKRKLRQDGIIVITGAPGEGKSSLAKQLVLELSPNKYVKLETPNHWDRVKKDTEIVLIDDMFGAGVFDQEGSRKWQKYFPSIAARKENPDKRIKIIIASRAYILEEARDKLFLGQLFTANAIFTLSSNDLKEKEKRKILENRFKQKDRDESLIQNILDSHTKNYTPFTIGFPECARLFTSNDKLFDRGASFFESPMASVKSLLSELFQEDEIFVAFFVLWAQTSHTLSALATELPLERTDPNVKDPITKLQFFPGDYLRKIRYVLHKHTHKHGFVLFDKEREEFSFSHRVISDAVGLVAYEKNPTAVLGTCDQEFIKLYLCTENVAGDEQIIVSPARFFQLSDRICTLSLSNQYNQSLLFKLPLFENESFYTEFMKTANSQEMLLPILTKTIKTVGAEFAEKTSFLAVETEMCLSSFLINTHGTISPFCRRCLQELDANNKEYYSKEIKLSMLLAVKEGWSNVVRSLIERGGNVDISMMVVALLNDEVDVEMIEILKENIGIDDREILYEVCRKGYGPVICKLVKSDNWEKIYEKDKNEICPIQVAATNNQIAIVEDLLNISRNACQSYDTQTDKRQILVAIFDEAVKTNNKKMMDLLLKNKIPSTSSEVFSSLVLAFTNKRAKVSMTLLDLAIMKKIPIQSEPDSENNTLLNLAMKNYNERLQKAKKASSSEINPWLEITKRLCQSLKK